MRIVELKDIASPEAAPYSRLTEAQLKRAGEGSGLFIAESINVIKAALEAGYRPVSLLTERKHIERIETELGAAVGEAPVYTSDEEELEKLAGYRLSRGVLCAMERRPLPEAEDILKTASRVAVLEGVTDPTNIGAIIRSAAALGMDAVLLGENCCDPLHRRAARVSMGAAFRIPWAVLPCLAACRNAIDLAPVCDNGFTTLAAALAEGAVCPDDGRLQCVDKLAVILGSEGAGLSERTVKAADIAVKLPMSHGMDSLNVAAAAAVLFWIFAKKPPKSL